MSYTKQNFENGQVLTAEHLNNMEDGIKAVSEEIANYSWNDLKDKPFGEGATEILPLSDVSFVFDESYGSSNAIIENNVPLTIGDTLRVTWDGIEYNLTIFMFSDLALFGNVGAFGLVDSGEPFVGSVDDDGALLIMDLTAQADVVRSVAISKVSITKMPAVYLPGAVTIFYFNGGDKYMYSDIGCTTKVTAAELKAAMSAGMVTLYNPAGLMKSAWTAAITPNGVGMVQIIHESAGGNILEGYLYTAEYTGS